MTYCLLYDHENLYFNFLIFVLIVDYQTWNDLNYDTKKSLIMHIIQVIELADKAERYMFVQI